MVANQNINLGILWALEWTMLVYFIVNWNILHLFGIVYSHLVYIVVICYIFSLFGKLYQEKSGDPGIPRLPNRTVYKPRYSFSAAEGAVVVQRVQEQVALVVGEAPEGLRVAPDVVLLPLLVAVVEEGAEQAGVQVVEDEGEEVLVELERVGELEPIL
jgi:hypothetical protein